LQGRQEAAAGPALEAVVVPVLGEGLIRTYLFLLFIGG
jgi:hypothetical protein